MKKIIMTLAIAALFSTSSYAMSTEQIGSRTVHLSGNTGNGSALVALDVLANGTNRADLETIKESGNLLDVWVTHQQTMADENGDFSFDFDFADTLPSGKYTAYAGIKDNEFSPYDFIFVSNADFEKMADEINTASVERIAEIIRDKNDCYVMGISEEQANNINAAKLAEVLKKTLQSTPFNKSDRDASWLISQRAYFAEQLNETKITDIFAVESRLTDFDNSDIADWYNKTEHSDEFKSDFTKRMSGRGFADYNAYKKALAEQFILATVKNPNGTGDIEDIMTAFKSEIGISVSASTPTTVWNKLAGNSYSDYDALKRAFNTYVGQGNTIGSGSSSSSSSSGSKLSSNVPSTPTNTSQTQLNKYIFDDVEQIDWARDAIVALAEKNIISGVGDNKFEPNDNVTREQFVKIVVGAFVPDAQAGELSFSDVKSGEWYEEYIAKAFNSGIVNGIDDNTFGVGRNITRQDMCVMIYNAAKAAGMEYQASADTFADDAQIADYAREAVYALRAAGAVDGSDNGCFEPTAFATRAQAAKIIYALIKQ
jgi:hypothetical protein